MIKLNNYDKRFLEVLFYLICRKIYSNNNNTQDVIDFIYGYKWTNLFRYDILIQAFHEEHILNNTNLIPSKQEILIIFEHPQARLRIRRAGTIFELIRDTNYDYKRASRYKAKMYEEVYPTEIIPKMQTKNIHETIYSFLISIRYFGDLIHNVKF